MPTLSNPKHELFAHYRALGQTQGEAYRQSHGSKGNEQTCRSEGCVLESDPIISQRISELKDWNAAKLGITRESVAQMFLDLAKSAETETARLGATNALSKMFGFNEVEKKEIQIGASTGQKTFSSLFEDDEEESE